MQLGLVCPIKTKSFVKSFNDYNLQETNLNLDSQQILIVPINNFWFDYLMYAVILAWQHDHLMIIMYLYI